MSAAAAAADNAAAAAAEEVESLRLGGDRLFDAVRESQVRNLLS